MIDQSEYLGCYLFLHWINYFNSALFEKKNCTAVNQSEWRNFFMYIISASRAATRAISATSESTSDILILNFTRPHAITYTNNIHEKTSPFWLANRSTEVKVNKHRFVNYSAHPSGYQLKAYSDILYDSFDFLFSLPRLLRMSPFVSQSSGLPTCKPHLYTFRKPKGFCIRVRCFSCICFSFTTIRNSRAISCTK